MVSKQKILIVDDDENIAELISLYLTKECFETSIVYDGESALEAVKTFRPNLILLDLMLPGIDGYQVCREVRSSSSIPIIMLSAKGEIFDKTGRRNRFFCISVSFWIDFRRQCIKKAEYKISCRTSQLFPEPDRSFESFMGEQSDRNIPDILT